MFIAAPHSLCTTGHGESIYNCWNLHRFQRPGECSIQLLFIRKSFHPADVWRLRIFLTKTIHHSCCCNPCELINFWYYILPRLQLKELWQISIYLILIKYNNTSPMYTLWKSKF